FAILGGGKKGHHRYRPFERRGASRTCTETLDASGQGVKDALFSNDPFSLPGIAANCWAIVFAGLASSGPGPCISATSPSSMAFDAPSCSADRMPCPPVATPAARKASPDTHPRVIAILLGSHAH